VGQYGIRKCVMGRYLDQAEFARPDELQQAHNLGLSDLWATRSKLGVGDEYNRHAVWDLHRRSANFA
jgi:hypothetical protein